MSRIVVTSCAYLGDVAPYIPVARRLAERGHDVAFLVPEGFHPMLADEPFALATYPLDCSSSGMHADPKHERLMRHPRLNMGRLGHYWMGKAFGDDPAVVRTEVLSVMEGADAVVTHPTMGTVALPLAKSLGIPTVVGHLFPMMLPTRHWTPPLGQRSPNLGAPVNKAIWTAMRYGSHQQFYGKELDALRVAVGQPKHRGAALDCFATADRTVVLASPHYYGRTADDWPPVTWGGFSVWEGSGDPTDGAAERFVDAGDAPVLVTLGTSAATGAGEQFRRIADDLDGLGLRSVLLVGDAANLGPLHGRDGAFTFAPLTALLPKCRAAVVSGALGGIAAALTAGVPVVVLPQLFDQVWNGRRMEELGVGVLVNRASKVAAAVAKIEADPGYRTRARALAERMAGEDGAGALADATESVL